MYKFLTYAVLLSAVAFFAFLYYQNNPTEPFSGERVYIAVEGAGKIAVLDPRTRSIVSSFDMPASNGGAEYRPHNVQVSPDNRWVWATANIGSHGDSHGAEEHGNADMHTGADGIVAFSTVSYEDIVFIPIAPGAHMAHVVFTPDGEFAYATAQEEDAVFKLRAGADSKGFEVVKKIPLPEGSGPHGIRIAPDGSSAYIALFSGKGLAVLDTETDAFSNVSLSGQAVQTGVTPDGRTVIVSIYDTKQVAVYRTDTQDLSYVDLPEGARGPVQVYPTPDSRFAYVADQGHLLDQPEGEMVYKIDLERLSVVQEIRGGRGPHGVAVSTDGAFAYVTNLLSGDVSIIDTQSDTEVARIPVGAEPNGISVWRPPHGDTSSE